jgi:preprotein translocase subunit SecG
MGIWQWLLALVMIFTCLLLMVVILLQRGRGGGLAGAFGGAGGSSAFGAKTGDVFTWITVVVAGVFILLSIAGTFVFDQSRTAAPRAVAVSEGTGAAGTPTESEPITIDPSAIKIEGGPDLKIEKIENPFAQQPGEQPAQDQPKPAAGDAIEPQPAADEPPPPAAADQPAEAPKQEPPPQENPNP